MNHKKYQADPEGEVGEVKKLIAEEIGAGFYNIDVDTSTLVDLSQATLEEQQRLNYERAAEITAFIRAQEPEGVTVSVGAEIGEVGMKNSTVEELHAFMQGYNRALAGYGGGRTGISKISVQTGTSHGGVVLPDGSIADVKLDLQALAALSKAAREEYGLAGAVQHGASTLPSNAFGNFPRIETAEIHLATNFQNIVFDHPQLPTDLRDRLRAWVDENAAGERKSRRYRRAVLLQGQEEGDRALQARVLVAAGKGPRRHRRRPRTDVRLPVRAAQRQRNREGHQSFRPGADAAPRGAQAGAGGGGGRPRRRGIGGGRMGRRTQGREVVYVERGGDASAKWLFWGAVLGAGIALLYAPRSGEETRRVLQRKLWKLRAMTEEKLDDFAQQFGSVKEALEEPAGRRRGARGRRTRPPPGPRACGDRRPREELERRLAESRARRRAAGDFEEPLA